MKQFFLGCAIGVAILAGIAWAVTSPDMHRFAREYGLFGKTDNEQLSELIDSLRDKERYKMDLAVPLDKPGVDVAMAIGVDAVRNSLKDPESAKFGDTLVTHNSTTGRIFVCGMVNAKNGYGAYSGKQAFYTQLDLASSVERSRALGVHFFHYEGYGGKPGEAFAERCGVGFLLDIQRANA